MENLQIIMKQQVLKDEVIYSITEDLKGNIWFSTHNAGLYKFDGKTLPIIQIQMA